MKSPFPGMDPYIEACGLWESFYGHLIEAIYQAIAKVLPQGYTADTAVRSYVVLMESEGKKETLAKPDVTVTQPAAAKKPRKRKGGVAVLEPAQDAEARPDAGVRRREIRGELRRDLRRGRGAHPRDVP